MNRERISSGVHAATAFSGSAMQGCTAHFEITISAPTLAGGDEEPSL